MNSFKILKISLFLLPYLYTITWQEEIKCFFIKWKKKLKLNMVDKQAKTSLINRARVSEYC